VNLNYSRPGIYRLPVPRHATRCEAVVTIRGDGAMKVVILRS
jgi:hypothetical protein